MKKAKLLLTLLLMVSSLSVVAQRQNMDKLDRGLIAVQTTSGVYCSWRIQADEYYDVTYNLYRNGTKVNAEPLKVSNYVDASGSASSTYTVRAVVRGKEQSDSKVASVLAQSYKEIVPKHDASLKCTYVPNDACCLDVNGDGELEILMKFDNAEESSQLYPKEGPTVNNVATKEYSLLECLDQKGNVLWWVNCGPNMGDFQNNEQNIVGYDWDGDGKGEVVMRLVEGATIHMADGTTYTIGADGKNGTSWTNYRIPKVAGGVEWFTYYGNEYLLYVNGETGKPYQCITYPAKRLEAGETDLNKAWGDGYGHRSNKHFFGAPYLDGKKPSIFIGRGIYTRHKFYAFDVNPATHELTERWHWTNNQAGSPWYGQGYHNYSIADVDWDGRDEIIWGSMVIDDNGKGLSTTGLGHGDAHHVSDFNPYVRGQEGFFCNEDEPQNNYRDLTTSKIYYRTTGTADDGRAIMGNFYNEFPGAAGTSSKDASSPISAVTNNHVTGSTAGVNQNFRIYWDGDLLEETFNGTGSRNSNGKIEKPGTGARVATLEGSLTNNDTKATPCYQGDIYGDWREEVIMRTSSNNIRIYTTTIPTEWRNYSLWYDHQYRNAMVWQMCGYNQPPHVSYFLGELEGITQAPPPLTTQGREVVANGGSIGTSLNGKHALVYETKDATVSVAEGASPAVMTFNVPTWIQGTAPSECTEKDTPIEYDTYTLTVTGGAFTGETRLVKQGDGDLILPNVTQTYTGPTDIWAGSVKFDGTMQSSPVWLNRFAELISDGGVFNGGIKADYASMIQPGGIGNVGTITTTTLKLGFGSRIKFDVIDGKIDQVKATTLDIEKKNWDNGPEYSAPVFEFTQLPAVGKYAIVEAANITGNLNDIVIVGLAGAKASISYEDGKIYLTVDAMRSAEDVVWTGAADGNWDIDHSANFKSSTGTFVPGDKVTFDDTAANTNVAINEDVTPKSTVFNNNSKTYTLSGSKGITGEGSMTFNGIGTVKINNINTYSGGTNINAGTVIPSSLANDNGNDYGALGGFEDPISIDNLATLKAETKMVTSQPIYVGKEGGKINTAANLTIGGIQKLASEGIIYKEGNGTLQLDGTSTFTKMYINAGTVYDFGDNHFNNKTIVLNGGTLQYNNSIYSDNSDNVAIHVPTGKTGTWLPDGRCNYTGKLTGDGTLKITATWVRCPFQGNWSEFEGTIQVTQGPKNSYDPTFDFNNTYGIGKATLHTNAGSNVHFNGKNFAIGALTGSGALYNNGNWGSTANTLTIGGKNTDFTFSGSINGSNVIKNGTGVWTIAAASVLANAKSLTITEGAVKLNNQESTDNMAGSTITYTKTNGELRGMGLIYGLNMNRGGGIRPGANKETAQTSNTGYISINRNLSADAGSHIWVNKTSNDSTTVNPKTGKVTPGWAFVKVGGNATLNGTIHVTYKTGSAGWTPKEGDYVRVIDCKGTISGTPDFDLQDLPDGLGWDTSTLLTDGTIRIVKEDTVRGDANGDGEVTVTDIVHTANAILGQTPEGFKKKNADSNQDGEITVTDIVYDAQYILNNVWPTAAQVKAILRMMGLPSGDE